MNLVICHACSRHIRRSDGTRCHFCGAALVMPPPLPRITRRSRRAILVATAALGVACGARTGLDTGSSDASSDAAKAKDAAADAFDGFSFPPFDGSSDVSVPPFDANVDDVHLPPPPYGGPPPPPDEDD